MSQTKVNAHGQDESPPARLLSSYHVYTREDGKRCAVLPQGDIVDDIATIIIVDENGHAQLRVISNADLEKLPIAKFKMVRKVENIPSGGVPAPPLCAIIVE